MTVDKARKGRAKRGTALAALAQGRYPLRDAVRDPPKTLVTCPLYRVLQAAPGMGPQKVRDTCERANVWPLLQLGELSPHQRQSVIDNLPNSIQ